MVVYMNGKKVLDKWGFEYNPLYAGIKRFVKVSLAILISGYIAYINENPGLIFLAPVLLGVEKYLQEKGFY